MVGQRVMAARCWHDPSLPPILALHGWLDNAATFDLLAPLLPEYHIVALDFAGHGWSDHRPAGCRYHVLDHLDDVLAVANQLGWSRFSLLGHSMGAGVGALLAAALPERIERVILIDGLGPYTGESQQATQYLRDALLEWQDYRELPAKVMTTFEVAVQARKQGLLPVGEEAARLLCQRGVRAVDGGFVWTTDRRLRLKSPHRFSEEQVRAWLATIQAPTLLIAAEQTLPMLDEAYRQRLTVLPHIQYQRLAGGHHLHLDGQQQTVAKVVRQFCLSVCT